MASDLQVAVLDDEPVVVCGVVGALELALGSRGRVAGFTTSAALLASEVAYNLLILDLEQGDGRPFESILSLVPGTTALVYHRGVLALEERGRCRRARVTAVSRNQPMNQLVAAASRLLDCAVAHHGETGRPAPHLAPREREVLIRYVSGRPLKSVAVSMGISLDTAREYIKRVARKYDAVGRPAHSKLEMYIRALEDGLVPHPRSTGVWGCRGACPERFIPPDAGDPCASG